jgi:hypothetical protein
MKTAKCSDCKSLMIYNNYYHCYSCDCGSTFNIMLQSIKPVEEWQDEYEDDY